MTIQQQVKLVSRRTLNIERMLKEQLHAEQWLPEASITQLYGYSAKTLQRMRKDGTLRSSDFKCDKRTGRNFRYRKQAIENLFQ